MTKKKRFGISLDLQRGISETINVVENNKTRYRGAVIPISRIELDPENPRKISLTPEDVNEGIKERDIDRLKKKEELDTIRSLAQTIVKNGLINPIVVYKNGDKYRVVAGERRFLATISINKTEIEARVFNEKPKELDLKLIQWAENNAREDLCLAERLGNIVDVISSYEKLNIETKITSSLMCDLTGLSKTQAKNYLSVIRGKQDVSDAIQKGYINNLDKAVLLVAVKDDSSRHDLIKKCMRGLGLKELKQCIAQLKLNANKNNVQNEPLTSKKRFVLGTTSNLNVVKAIINSILENPSYKDIDFKIARNNIDSKEGVIKSLAQLIKSLECVVNE